MQLIKKHNNTQIDKLSDLTFFIFIFTEPIFKHTIIGQLGIIMFLTSVFLLVIEKKKFNINYYFFFSFLFILYNYLNIKFGNSINDKASLEMIKTLILNFIILFFLFNYFMLRGNIQNQINIFVKAIFFATIFISIIFIPNLFNRRLGGSFSFLGYNFNINANSISLISAISFLFCYYNNKVNKNKNLLYMIWFIIIILLTGSRSGFLTLFIGLFIFILLSYQKNKFKYFLILLIFILLTYISIMYIPAFYNILGWRLDEFFNFIFGRDFDEGSLQTRIQLIQTGWNYFLKRPFYGYGLDSFRHLPKSYSTYSHNNFIELMVSGGIISLFLYYFPFVLLCINQFVCIKSKKQYNVKTIMLFFSIILSLFIMDYTTVSYYNRIPLTIVIFTFASLNQEKKFGRLKND